MSEYRAITTLHREAVDGGPLMAEPKEVKRCIIIYHRWWTEPDILLLKS